MNLNYLKRIFIFFFFFLVFISCSRLFKITERLSQQEKNVLSLANLHISNFSIIIKISLIKILKSGSPGMDPWEIPLVILVQSHYEEPIIFSLFPKM